MVQQMTNYFNIAFILFLLIALSFGLLKGYKKGLYWFIVMAFYYVLFFISIHLMTNLFWAIEMPWLGRVAGLFNPELAQYNRLQDIMNYFVTLEIGSGFDHHPEIIKEFSQLGNAMAQLGFKVIYTIFYFTVFHVFYKLIFGLIRFIFIRYKPYEQRHRMAGALLGLGQGVLAITVTVILFSGLINLSNETQAFISKYEEATGEIVFEEGDMDYFQAVIQGYNSSFPVRLLNNVTAKEKNTNDTIPLPLKIFDSTYSIPYKGKSFSLRKELSIFFDVYTVYLDSEVVESNNFADFSTADVRQIVQSIQRSDLIPLLAPMGIEIFYIVNEEELPVERETLYGIEWKNELHIFGEVIILTYELIEASGIFEEEVNLEEVTIDGDQVEIIFNELAESQMINEAAVAVALPLIQANEQLKMIITIPEDIEMDTEIRAIGMIAKELFNTNITVGDLRSGDLSRILTVIDGLDLTVLLESRIVSEAMINFLSGYDSLIIPENLQWHDTYLEGERVEEGELRRILVALQSLTPLLEGFDFRHMSLSFISRLTETMIDRLFESEVLVATVSKHLDTLELGSIPIVLADELLDENQYLEKQELKRLVLAAKILFDELHCSNCINEIDIDGIFNLKQTEIQQMLQSQIVTNTIGHLITDQASDQLVIPDDVVEWIAVDGELIASVNRTEIQKILLAGQLIGLDSMYSVTVNVLNLKGLTVEDSDLLDHAKAEQVFDSKIIHSTTTKLIRDASVSNREVIVPSVMYNGEPLIETQDGVEYIAVDELNHLLQAVITLNIDDFKSVVDFDLKEMAEKVPTLVNSAIIHASISHQILSLDPSLVFIPQYRYNDQPLTMTFAGDSKYVDKSEIIYLADVATILNINHVNDFTGDIDLTPMFEEGNQDQLLRSSLIHYHLSQLVLTKQQSYFVTPRVNVTGDFIRETIKETDEYLTKEEVKALIGALEVLGIKNVYDFTNQFDLTNLSTETNQNKLLQSAIIHATLSEKLLALDEDVIVVPMYKEADLDQPIQINQSGVTFIIKDELKAMMNSFIVMGYTNLDNFEIQPVTSHLFFNARHILLESASIQATISQRLLENTVISIPDDVRVEMPDVTYITQDELTQLLDALETLGLTDFDAFDFSAFVIVSPTINYQEVVSSRIMQVTISKEILTFAVDETVDTNNRMLIVPTTLREQTTVDRLPQEQIKKEELRHLLEGLCVLAITGFDAPLSAMRLNELTEDDIDQILQSSSLHYTVQHMINDNQWLVVPEYAKDEYDNLSTKTITVEETKDFIIAVQTLANGDITNVTFDYTTIRHMNNQDQDVVLTSIIVRATVSEPMIQLVNMTDPNYLKPHHFEDENVLTKEAIQAIFNDFL